MLGTAALHVDYAGLAAHGAAGSGAGAAATNMVGLSLVPDGTRVVTVELRDAETNQPTAATVTLALWATSDARRAFGRRTDLLYQASS